VWWNTSLVGRVDHHEIKPSRLARQQKDSANSRVVGNPEVIQKRACGKSEGGIQGTRGFVKQVNATGSSSET
jgi:hypothetical protein